MLALTKSALHGTIPDEKLFAGVSENEWNEVFEHAAAHGVLVLSLEGIIRLPKELQPPHSVKLQWLIIVDTVEKKYRHCLEIAKELSARFRENNIRMMVFKGVALSRLYPVPASREFGDIDIFLCGKSQEGNAILKLLTGQKGESSQKHSNFYYRKVLIENHHTFLNLGSYKSFQHGETMEKRLMATLTEAGSMEGTNFFESTSEDNLLLFPPPDFDALFVTLHTLTHFTARIVLRQLCDLTVLFTAYKGKINLQLYRQTLDEAGLSKLAGALISLCVSKLGLNPEYAPPYQSDISLENRIWNDMINPEVSPLPKEKRSLLKVFFYKIQLLQSRRWKSELVFPGQYGKRILFSTVYHLRHPQIIGKLF